MCHIWAPSKTQPTGGEGVYLSNVLVERAAAACWCTVLSGRRTVTCTTCRCCHTQLCGAPSGSPGHNHGATCSLRWGKASNTQKHILSLLLAVTYYMHKTFILFYDSWWMKLFRWTEDKTVEDISPCMSGLSVKDKLASLWFLGKNGLMERNKETEWKRVRKQVREEIVLVTTDNTCEIWRRVRMAEHRSLRLSSTWYFNCESSSLEN